MMRCSMLLLALALLPPRAAGDASQEQCSDADDQASLLSVRTTRQPQQPVLMTLNVTLGASTRQQVVYRVQGREWGAQTDPKADRQAAMLGLGDGRWLSYDPIDAEELWEDAQEEKDLTADQNKYADIRNKAMDMGMMFFDTPPTLPPLQPRVRDVDGCLLPGPPEPLAPKPGVDGVLVINLDSRPDRWEFMQNSSGLQSLGAPVRRLPAIRLRTWADIDKLNETQHNIATDKIAHTHKALRRARDSKWEKDNARYLAKLSCWMSHLEAITTLAQEARHKDQIYLVMEDDHMLTRDLGGLIPYISHAVGDDWDAIRLDCSVYGQAKEPRPNRLVFKAKNTQTMGLNYGGSQAVLYRGETLWKVAKYWREEPFREADAMFWTFKIRSYCVNWNITKRAAELGSNVNNVTSYRMFKSHNESAANKTDPYEEYIKEAKMKNPNRKITHTPEREIIAQREEHASFCMERHRKLRLHNLKLIRTTPEMKYAVTDEERHRALVNYWKTTYPDWVLSKPEMGKPPTNRFGNGVPDWMR